MRDAPLKGLLYAQLQAQIQQGMLKIPPTVSSNSNYK